MCSWPSSTCELRPGGEVAAEHDLLRPRGDVDEAAAAGGHVRLGGEARDVDAAVAVDLHERQQRAVEARTLEVGELLRRGHDRLGIGRAAELEVEQRHAAHGTLLDHPGDVAVAAFLEQHARHVGRDAEAEIDRPAGAQLLRHTARDHLVDAPGRAPEAALGADSTRR